MQKKIKQKDYFNSSKTDIVVAYFNIGTYNVENAHLAVAYKGNILPAGNNLFKVKNRNTRPRYEICSKLTLNTPEQRH